MGCSEGTTNENCENKQTFCILNGQSVLNNKTGIGYTLPTITQGGKINASTWNDIITVLNKIYNYGNRGTRNPPINGLSTAPQGDKIYLTLYNQIRSAIGLSNETNNVSLTKILIDNLKTSIESYQLNTNRCNSCNTTCNTNCQANSQGGGDCRCVEYDCGQCTCWNALM